MKNKQEKGFPVKKRKETTGGRPKTALSFQIA